ncbi:MAG: SDR family oxidoreductase [Verrucomicrobiota bacterium]
MSSIFSLKGRTALVTGSSRGIGRAILLAFAGAGADVIVHGVTAGDASRGALSEATKLGVSAHFIPGDLGAPSGGRILAETALRDAGKIDVLVLNASLQIRKPWQEITPEEYESQMRTNFQASLEMIQALAPPMQKRGWGRILSIGSVQESTPHPHMVVYAASKAAQTHMMLNLAKQLAPDGVTLNNLAPGVIRTDRNVEALADGAYAEKVRSAIPAGIFGQPSDCAGAALLLCSDAGRYITGQNLFVDGGMSR